MNNNLLIGMASMILVAVGFNQATSKPVETQSYVRAAAVTVKDDGAAARVDAVTELVIDDEPQAEPDGARHPVTGELAASGNRWELRTVQRKVCGPRSCQIVSSREYVQVADRPAEAPKMAATTHKSNASGWYLGKNLGRRAPLRMRRR